MNEPAYTCPIIDKCLGFIGDAETALSHATDCLEEVRSANEELRNWGRYYESEFETKCDEYATLEAEHNEALELIETLKAEIAELESHAN